MAAGGRRRVLERVRESKPALLALVAPPGFEKHEIAYEYARLFDCVIELDDVPRDDFALSPRQCVIVPNTLSDDPDRLRSILKRIVNSSARDASIVVCCDREPPFSFVEFAPPNDTLVFRRSDLSLDLDDVRGLCERPALAYEILNVSQGWPFVARYLAEHRGIGLSELMDWLDITVVRKLDEPTLRALLEIVVRMDARPEDIAPPAVDELSRAMQLVDIGTTGELRPLRFLRDFFYERRRRELIEAAYRVVDSDASDDPVRAARALVNVGEVRAAENLLQRVDPVAVASLGSYPYPVTSAELRDVIPPPYYLYPRVWFGLVGARSFTRAPQLLADEARTILGFDAVDDAIRPYILWTAAVWSIRGGHVAEAVELAQKFSLEYGTACPDLAALVFVFNDAILGKVDDVEERWYAHVRALVAFPTLYALGARVIVRALLSRGDVEKATELLRLTLTLARGGGSPYLVASAAAEAAYIAWLLDERDDFARRRDEAVAVICNYDAVAYWQPVAAMCGDDIGDAFTSDALWEARSLAILAARSTAAEATGYARRAVAAAERAHGLSALCLTHAIATLRDPERESAYRKRLRELLEMLHAPALRTFVQAFLGEQTTQVSPFSPLLERLKTENALLDAGETMLLVDLARGTVSGSADVTVSEGTLALLACIAVHGGSVKRDVLLRHLWPDVEPASAHSALKMCIHRARLQLGDTGAILVTKGSYAFGPRLRSNYGDIVDAAARTYGNPLPASDRERLAQLFDALATSGDWCASWTWFAPYFRDMKDAAMRFGELLARDALERSAFQRALHVTRTMLAIRPLDELSRLLAIEVYLASDDRAGAMREYREHETLVRSKLGIEPSARMRQLLASA